MRNHGHGCHFADGQEMWIELQNSTHCTGKSRMGIVQLFLAAARALVSLNQGAVFAVVKETQAQLLSLNGRWRSPLPTRTPSFVNARRARALHTVLGSPSSSQEHGLTSLSITNFLRARSWHSAAKSGRHQFCVISTP